MPGNAIVLFISVLAVVLLGLYLSRRKVGKKQCPKCGAYCHQDADVCEVCGYRFAAPP